MARFTSPPTRAAAEAAEAEVETPVVPGNDALAQVLGKLLRDADAGPIPQISVAKAKYRTPWHPSGDKNRPKLACSVRMNGVQLRERILSDEEITLLNEVKPGRYHGKKWLVMETTGDEGVAKYLYIPNKTVEDRMAVIADAKDLAGILKLIVAEARA